MWADNVAAIPWANLHDAPNRVIVIELQCANNSERDAGGRELAGTGMLCGLEGRFGISITLPDCIGRTVRFAEPSPVPKTPDYESGVCYLSSLYKHFVKLP